MREIVSKLEYHGEDADSINRMLQLRASAVVGMADGEPDMQKDPSKTWFVNRGTTAQQQFNLADNVGWDVAKQEPINSDVNVGFFRPCFNSYSIHNNECKYEQPNYDWINFWANGSYHGSANDLFPFTGHGWTYDWQAWNEGRGSPIGLNEFVIPKGAKTQVNWTKSQTPLEYVCEICKDQDCGKFTAWANRTSSCGCGQTTVHI